MTDVHPQKGQEMQQQHKSHEPPPRSKNMVKAATAATAGSSLLFLSGLRFAGTVMELTMGSPLLVLLSPVLVPAVITSFLFPTGFLTSGSLGVAATKLLSWVYKYVTAGRPARPDSSNQQSEMDKKQLKQDDGFDTNNSVNYTTGAGRGGREMAKAVASTTAGGASLILSGLSFSGTVISLVVDTPLLVIFSPVLVPAVITVFLLATGFLASGGFAVAGMTVLVWLYRYVTGGHPAGAGSFDQGTHKLGLKGGDDNRSMLRL